MNKWQLDQPVSAIIFDCDGTLSSIEGIDELARENGVGSVVAQLTAEAMTVSGMNPALYQQRLDLVQPTEVQVIELGNTYYKNVTPDVAKVIQLLTRLNKSIYVMSAGLKPAVSAFSKQLHIPSTNIFAVDIQFDKNGKYTSYDQLSPLAHGDGKQQLVRQLLKKHDRIIHVGDGMNDYAVYDLVTRFIGYGGAYYRENIEAVCQYYIKTKSLAAVLPLTLTATECSMLMPNEEKLYEKGFEGLKNGKNFAV